MEYDKFDQTPVYLFRMPNSTAYVHYLEILFLDIMKTLFPALV